jgi:hypothetical protein
MANPADSKKEVPKSPPPTKGLSFLVGLMLFGIILCPAGVFIFYNFLLFKTLGITMLASLSLGCSTGLLIAVIPAYVFMQLAMKSIKQ